MENAKNRLFEMAAILDKNKGRDIVALDVSGMTVVCDYMLIVSGRNAVHTKSLADELDDRMRESGLTPLRSEGQKDGRWIILDYGDILVEIFHPEEREYYHLERLWEDGTNRVELALTPD